MFRRDRWWQREIEKIRRENAAREAELIATICKLAAAQPLIDHQPAAEPEEDDTPPAIYSLEQPDQPQHIAGDDLLYHPFSQE